MRRPWRRREEASLEEEEDGDREACACWALVCWVGMMDWIGLLGKKERQPTFCLGFLMGYNSYIGLSTSSDGDAKKKVCSPPSTITKNLVSLPQL